MPKVFVNNINIYYEIHGQGEPLLLIPGLGSDHSRWLGVLEQLAKDFQVILIDSRDSGQSDSTDCHYTVATMAQDTAALLQELNIKKAHILGHSMGGGIAQYLAADFPDLVNKLILYSTAAKFSTRSAQATGYNVELLNKGLEPELVFRNTFFWLYSNELLASEEKIQQLLNDILSNPFPQSLESFVRQLTACAEADTRSLLAKIKVPTLIIAGDNDIMTTKEDLNSLRTGIPHAEVKVFPNMAHCTHIELPDEFVATVKTFFLSEK
jgi:pimeloyl-ACP methyl ester carboxylesterase